MSRAPRSPRLVLALGLLVVVGLSIAPAWAAGDGLAQRDSPTDQREQDNQSPDEGSNQTQGEDGSRDSQARGEDERRDGERGAADPVEIRDRPGGFASKAPMDSPRPTVAVNVSEGRAVVQRPDVQPLSVHLDTLVEFEDEDGDGGYDVGEPVERRVDLGDIPTRVVRDDATATRTVVYEIGNASRLELTFDFGTDRGELVASKLDVTIEDYPFEDDDHKLALGSRVQVDGGLERVTHEGKPALAGEQGEEVSYLSWAEQVAVDGQTHQVASTVHVSADEASDSAIVYWAYPQGERIVHDPTFGVSEAVRDLAGSLAAFGLGLAATVGLLGVGFVARERWRI